MAKSLAGRFKKLLGSVILDCQDALLPGRQILDRVVIVNKGTKKGDPLAPFLFIAAVEGVARLIRKAEESKCFMGFLVNENLSISLLQFADDKMIVCDGGESKMWCLKAILRSFELASGLKINFAKSNVLGVNIEDRVQLGASVFLACSIKKNSL